MAYGYARIADRRRNLYAYVQQKTIPRSTVRAGFGGGPNGAACASPAQARRRLPLARSPRPANLAGRPVGGLCCFDCRRQRGQERLARLGGQLRRQERTPDDARPRERIVAALESGRKISLVHFITARGRQGQSGLAARPRRRRGVSIDRRERALAVLRMVAGFEATGVGRRRSRP